MIGKISGVITDMTEEFSQVSASIDKRPVDVKQPSRAARALNLRADLIEAGITHEQVRDRLNGYVAGTSACSRSHALEAAVRFTRWLSGEQTIKELVVSQNITRDGIRRNFNKLAGVAFNDAYDIEHTLGDVIGSAMDNPAESKNPQKLAARIARAGMIGSEIAFVDDTASPRAVLPGETSLDDPILAWQTYALCAQTDPEAFFPEKGQSTEEAKKICNACEVSKSCLAYALKNGEEFGTWGGRDESELRELTAHNTPNYSDDTA